VYFCWREKNTDSLGKKGVSMKDFQPFFSCSKEPNGGGRLRRVGSQIFLSLKKQEDEVFSLMAGRTSESGGNE